MEEKTRIPLLLSLMYICTEVSSFTFCEKSAATTRYVNRCPTDLETWKIAAKNMNCESIKQNCSSGRHHFQYHCVINEWINATLEVCAPNRTIFGYCTEYNVMGHVIQENYAAECVRYDPPCPQVYNSAEAYKYQRCYERVRKNKDWMRHNVRSTSERPCGQWTLTFLSIFQMMRAGVLRWYSFHFNQFIIFQFFMYQKSETVIYMQLHMITAGS